MGRVGLVDVAFLASKGTELSGTVKREIYLIGRVQYILVGLQWHSWFYLVLELDLDLTYRPFWRTGYLCRSSGILCAQGRLVL